MKGFYAGRIWSDGLFNVTPLMYGRSVSFSMRLFFQSSFCLFHFPPSPGQLERAALRDFFFTVSLSVQGTFLTTWSLFGGALLNPLFPEEFPRVWLIPTPAFLTRLLGTPSPPRVCHRPCSGRNSFPPDNQELWGTDLFLV